MPKQVVVIASGETERRALPHLLAHLRSANIEIASWFARGDSPPDKIVLLLDADGNAPDDVLAPFRNELPRRIGPSIHVQLQFACAQWHLEAWYFGDPTSLRDYLGGRDLGKVDSSKPDEIQNPKLHWKHLLGERVYTAIISEEIAAKVNPQTIAQRSPSFQGFLEAVRNGRDADASRAN